MSEQPIMFPALTTANPEDAAMIDDEIGTDRRSGQDRRQTPDSSFTQHVAAADVGISRAWRWAQIGTTIVCFGFTLGVMYTKFGSTETAIRELRSDVKTASTAATAADKQLDLQKLTIEQQRRDIDRLERELNKTQGQLDNQRSMREAYVYSSASKSGKMPISPPP